MQDSQPKASRRGFFVSASVVGAAAVGASWVATRSPQPVAAPLAEPPARGGGYSLSEHVKHYYRTARV